MEKQGVEGLRKRKISSMGIAFLVFSMVCAGAFGVEEMVPSGGPGLTLIFLMAFPIIWAWPISNMFAECGAILPREGGIYAWAKEAYGEFWGFSAGWWNTMTVYITNSVYVVLAVGYASQYIPMSETGELVAKMGMIVIFTALNLLGLKEVATVNTFLAIAVMAAFALVAIVGFVNWNTNPMTPIVPDGVPIQEAVGGILALTIWMYCGYEAVSVLSGEVENAQKVVPKGLLIAMPLIALTYVLPTMAGLGSLGEGNWANWTTEATSASDVGYAAVLTTYLGPAWGYIFLVVAIIGQCAIFNTYIASGSRGFFVFADDNLFPKVMVKLSKNRKIPYIGVLSLAVVTAFLSQFPFETIVKMEVVFILGMYIILPFILHKLRRMYPVEDRIKEGMFVMPGGKLGLYFFTVLPPTISVLALMVNGTDYLLMGIVGLLSAMVFYIIFKTTCGGLTVNDPEKYPVDPKTKLAYGDIARIGFTLTLAGLLAFVGSFVLIWWEGSWGVEYYAEESGNVGFLADFWTMISILRWGGVVLFIIGVILYRADKKNMDK